MNIVLHPINSLLVHPARKALPYATPNPATLNSVAEIGVQTPLKVCRKDGAGVDSLPHLYVVDGMDRWRGALEAMIAEVPVEIIPESEVQTVLLHSLLARKHLTKSALAFVAFPLLEPAMEESRQRRVANLKKGQNLHKSLETPIVEKIHYGPKTVEDLAQMLGVDRKYIFAARNVHGFLKKVSAAKREEITERILAGEMDLTAAIHSLTGNESTAGKDRSTPGQLELFDRDLIALSTRWKKWSGLAEQQRRAAASKFAAQVEEWPEEVVQAVIARLQKGAK